MLPHLDAATRMLPLRDAATMLPPRLSTVDYCPNFNRLLLNQATPRTQRLTGGLDHIVKENKGRVTDK
jgi:hypothetical protein